MADGHKYRGTHTLSNPRVSLEAAARSHILAIQSALKAGVDIDEVQHAADTHTVAMKRCVMVHVHGLVF